MPWNQVFAKFKAGKLRSGGANGPLVKHRQQAIAIAMSEKKKAAAGNSEYAAADHPVRKLARGMKVPKK